jgi:hypothetical protein
MIATGPVILVLLAASPPGAPAPAAPLIDTIDFSALNAYASSWEGVSVAHYPQSSQTILTDPAITAEVTTLRDWVLSRWLAGESAVNKDQLYTEALTLTSDPGSALILCYHVCHMFARGFMTVYWQRVKTWTERDGGAIPAGAKVLPTLNPVTFVDYTDGTKFYRPFELNGALSGEVLKVNDRDSIFYLLFEKSEEWGVRDPGDWYHFFLMASIAYYAATGRITDMDLPENVREQVITALVRSTLQGMQKVGYMPEVPFTSMNPYDAAWLWANALSFVEGGIFGASREGEMAEEVEDVIHESGVHRKGCLYGLRLAGETHHRGYLHWWVPNPGVLAGQWGTHIGAYHPIDVADIAYQDDEEEAANQSQEGEFWEAVTTMGFDDPAIQGYLEVLRSRGPGHGRAARVLDGATGVVLTSHPVAGFL